ncbi:MAG: DUF4125 family protein [Clostridiales bacterium]|nr:DUF4125 family protein [Clostridiales bacterium]
MDMEPIISDIIDLEWDMFHVVNGENRVSCQENHHVFELMRRAQFSEWSREAAESYLEDLKTAKAANHNLAREKYIRMMASTAPDEYETLKVQLPSVSAEKEELVREIWRHFSVQTERMRAKYPFIALCGRPFHADEEQNGETSIETYQTGELMTYSERTLKALLKHIIHLEAEGIDMAYRIQENAILCLGYSSMEEAEKRLKLIPPSDEVF